MYEEEFIKQQDRLIYLRMNYDYEGFQYWQDEPLTQTGFRHLTDIIKTNPEIIFKMSTENLMLIFVYFSKMKDIENELMKRLEKGENLFTGTNIEITHLQHHRVRVFNDILELFSPQNQELIKQFIQKKLESLGSTNPYLYNLAVQLKTPTSQSNFLYYYEQRCFDNEIAIKLIEEISDNDNDLFNSIDFGMFHEDFLNINKETLMYILRYPNICKKLRILKDNAPELLDVFIDEINSLAERGESLSMIYEEIQRLSTNFAYYYPCLEGKSKNELLELGLNEFNYNTEFILDSTDESLDSFLNRKFETTKTRENDLDKKQELLQEKLEIFFNKYFSISLENARRIVNSYLADLPSIKVDVTEKEIQLLQEMQRILNINDFEEINKLFENYETRFSAKDIIKMEGSYRVAYAKRYIHAFNSTRKNISEEKKVEYSEYNGKKIKIVHLQPPFSLLLYSTDTRVIDGKRKLINDSFEQTWNNVYNVPQHLVPTTYINPDFMGVAPLGDIGVYYGFLPQNPNHLNLMGNEDINSKVWNFNYDAEHTRFFTT